jgi:hypothetical protein
MGRIGAAATACCGLAGALASRAELVATSVAQDKTVMAAIEKKIAALRRFIERFICASIGNRNPFTRIETSQANQN